MTPGAACRRAGLALLLVALAPAQQATSQTTTPTPAETAVARARQAVEAAPRDAEALSALVTALADAGQADEALHWAVELGRESGDAQLVATWSERLDPLRDERAALMLATARRWSERARWCADKSYYLQAAALYEGAAALARGASDADGQALALSADQARRDLARQRKAAERLMLHGAPLAAPGHATTPVTAAGSAPPTASGSPPAARPEPARVRTRHAQIDCALGREVAVQAGELVEALHDELAARFHDARSKTLLRLEILSDVSAFQSLRPGDSSGAVSSFDQLAFSLDGERRVVVLDPRAIGEPFGRLWGLIARETCRDRLRDVDIRLPPWLEQGLSVRYEGVRRHADGRFDLDVLPEARLDQVLTSLAGRGPLRPSLQTLLEVEQPDAGHSSWAWALTHYLLTAEDDQGQLLWADRLDGLLADLRQGVDVFPRDDRFGHRAPAPTAHFQQRILPADGDRAGIGDLRRLELHWYDWLRRLAALRAGQDEALAAELEAIRISQADDDRRARRLQRVLAARPDDEQALALAVEVEAARHELDAALLIARHLAAVRAPDDPERFAELTRLQSRLAADLAADDAALRAGVEELVGRYRAKGFPRTALTVLDAVLTAVPQDAGHLRTRDTLLRLYTLDDLVLRHAVPLDDAVRRAYGNRSLWLMSDDVLGVRLADRVVPDSLRGLVELRAPCEVRLTVDLLTREGPDDGGRFAGLTLGAAGPEQHGEWGLFTTPSGRIELATRGLLEWPSTEIGRVLPGPVTLELRFGQDDFEVLANDVSQGRRPYGSRPPGGWLGLYVRRADATFRDLVVTHHRDAPPPRPWYARGRP